MATQLIVGVFENLKAAEQARSALVRGGVAGERIAVSRSATAQGDATGSEAPGEAYENQPGQAEEDSAWARYGELLRQGGAFVSVEASAREKLFIEDLLKRNGARETAERED
jgi:hypothetical protein